MRVLVVDDNPTVRRTLVRLLGIYGFEAVPAEHGEVALVLLEEQSFDAILCDLMMPRMDGMTFFDQLRVAHPELVGRVIFLSAWTEEPELQPFLRHADRPVLQKPFEMPILIRQIRAVA